MVLSHIDTTMYNDRRYYYDCWHQNALIGRVEVVLIGKIRAEIDLVYINHKYRNRGWGMIFAWRLLRNLKKRGVKHVYVHNSPISNKWWTGKFGFTPILVTKCPQCIKESHSVEEEYMDNYVGDDWEDFDTSTITYLHKKL